MSMPAPAQAEGNAAICTLFEGDYHLGLAALLNSLACSEYSGTVWIGYRGSLPPWLSQLQATNGATNRYRVTGRIEIAFLPLDTKMHFTNYKPQFMLDLLSSQARDCRYLWYFDPDIYLRFSWSFFLDWQRHGTALCQDVVDNILPVDSPLRRRWLEIGSNLGLKNPQPLHHYYNAGMIGISSEDRPFLNIWNCIIRYAGELGCDLSKMLTGNRESLFHVIDQDALNIAAMYSTRPLATLGPQGMGFVDGGAAMYHSVGQKPWRGSFLMRALQGQPPNNAAKFFLSRVSSPIRAYSPQRLLVKRTSCSVAALIGRFYRRG